MRVPRIGYEHTDGFPYFAIDVCLQRAGLSTDNVEQITVTEDPPYLNRDRNNHDCGMPVAGVFDRERRHRALSQAVEDWSVNRIRPETADAIQVAMTIPVRDALVLVVPAEAKGRAAAFVSRDGQLNAIQGIDGFDALFEGAARIAAVLGCRRSAPYDGLEQLAAVGEPEFARHFAAAIRWRCGQRLVVDYDRISEILHLAGDRQPLNDPNDPNIHTQQRRRSVAASFLFHVAALVSEIAARLRSATGVEAVGLGGALFSNSGINTHVRHTLGGEVDVAAVPEPAGRAIGGALAIAAANGGAEPICGFRLGPSFSELQIKETLENCRLDYLYEPAWERLLTRISNLLANGKTVAWFQGPMEFGPRSFGSRSILCDPSNRYAAENINRFVKQRPEDHLLPVSLTEAAAVACLACPIQSHFMSVRAAVKEPCRDRLRAALDPQNSVLVHTVAAEQSPELWQLLEIHRQRTGVPGLINVPLSAPNEPTACSPRDAIRTTFSCGVDALVLGRFLLMKDYWLLRSDADR